MPPALQGNDFRRPISDAAPHAPAIRDVAMKRGVRPVLHACYQTVLERIDIAIFDVARIIRFIADQVLPETSLPDAALVSRQSNRVNRFLLWQRPYKAALDQAPTCREIKVAGRKAPDSVQMIRKYDERADIKSAALANCGDSFAQGLDMIDQQSLTAVQQIDREEPTPTWNERTTIVRHGMQDSTTEDPRTRGGLRFANPPYGKNINDPRTRLPR